jgi:signal peptidase I
MAFNEENNHNLREKYYGVGSFVWEIVKVFLLAFLIIVPIRVFLFQPFFVQGASMEPNFENNEYLIVNEFGYKKTSANLGGSSFFTLKPFKKLERQVPVVFRFPKNDSQFFIKRVIGLPGEKVELKSGKVTIYNSENPTGFLLDESAYLASNVKTLGEVTMELGAGEYFVMGDNRMFSSDSRAWGSVPEADIIGKVLLRAWPLDKINLF